MNITFNENTRIFHLTNATLSYVIKVTDANHLMHVYWGDKLNSDDLEYALRSRNFDGYIKESHGLENMHLEQLPQEFPTFGSNDMRLPALHLQLPTGSRTTAFKYVSHTITRGKKGIAGLPATFGSDDEVMTLAITLKEVVEDIEVTMFYSIFKNTSTLTRHVAIKNHTRETIKLNRVMSATLDISNFEGDFIALQGSWAKERTFERTPVRHGVQSISSRKGSSSHGLNPFLALCSKDTTETHGEVYAMNFVYSGNFDGFVEYDGNETARMGMGLGSFDFEWNLNPNDTFESPEVVLAYSNHGLGLLSHQFHALYENHLIRGTHAKRVRPVLINNWEATYFDFNTDRIVELAEKAASVGVELFVLDDGWFGERHADNSSLGDWVVNETKLNGGLKHLGDKINDLGMKFGLWFEPEMISPDSNLLAEHPDWHIHVPGRINYQARTQYVLNLARDEVADYIIDAVAKVLESANIEYVKWDYNRAFTDIFATHLQAHQQKELPHRFMLNVYRIMETLTSRFPNILFESCAGGGGRFDPGMLYYMPQIWTSDDTDAIERLKIQHGTSLAYPPASMGCHVSIVPNHQVGRITPLKTRGIVAMSGNFGYELDLMKLDETEINEIKEQIHTYKSIRETVQFGTLYRLQNYFEFNDTAWMFINKDSGQVVVNCVRQKGIPYPVIKGLKLQGLEKDAIYKDQNGQTYTGLVLMNVGLVMDTLHEDYSSMQWILERQG